MTAHMIDAESAYAARQALLQVLADLVENAEALAISNRVVTSVDRMAEAGRDIAIIAEALRVVSQGRN